MEHGGEFGVAVDHGVLLGGEVRPERPRGHAGAVADRLYGRAGQPVIRDQLERGVVDGLPGGEFLALAVRGQGGSETHAGKGTGENCSLCKKALGAFLRCPITGEKTCRVCC